MSRYLGASFLYLIDARLRSSTSALLDMVLKKGGDANGKIVSEAQFTLEKR